jgi:hypothetical protein
MPNIILARFKCRNCDVTFELEEPHLNYFYLPWPPKTVQHSCEVEGWKGTADIIAYKYIPNIKK